jgi:hypothetical protein
VVPQAYHTGLQKTRLFLCPKALILGALCEVGLAANYDRYYQVKEKPYFTGFVGILKKGQKKGKKNRSPEYFNTLKLVCQIG